MGIKLGGGQTNLSGDTSGNSVLFAVFNCMRNEATRDLNKGWPMGEFRKPYQPTQIAQP